MLRVSTYVGNDGVINDESPELGQIFGQGVEPVAEDDVVGVVLHIEDCLGMGVHGLKCN